jgi:hypothetical protein
MDGDSMYIMSKDGNVKENFQDEKLVEIWQKLIFVENPVCLESKYRSNFPAGRDTR